MGRHQSLPSGSMQQAPLSTSPTSGRYQKQESVQPCILQKGTRGKATQNEKAENRRKMRELDKTPEKQLSELERLAAFMKKTRIIIIKMISCKKQTNKQKNKQTKNKNTGVKDC